MKGNQNNMGEFIFGKIGAYSYKRNKKMQKRMLVVIVKSGGKIKRRRQ